MENGTNRPIRNKEARLGGSGQIVSLLNVSSLAGVAANDRYAGRARTSGTVMRAGAGGPAVSSYDLAASDVAPDARKGDMTGMEGDHVTGRELDAELKAIEERMDRRQAELGGKIDLLTQSLGTFANRVTDDVARIEKSVDAVKTDLQGNFDKLNAKVENVQEKSSQDKKQILVNLWVIVIGAALAGLAAIWTTNSLIISAIQVNTPAQVSTPAQTGNSEAPR